MGSRKTNGSSRWKLGGGGEAAQSAKGEIATTVCKKKLIQFLFITYFQRRLLMFAVKKTSLNRSPLDAG